MSQTILTPAEVEFYVQTLKPSEIEGIGSKYWFEEHQRLERLRQQCIVEATNNVDERVKDVVLTYEKIPVLVHEAVLIQLWGQKVWKKIIQTQGKKIRNGFICYMISYHECTAINFLQILLHHREVVLSLQEESLDLIDYCACKVIYICSKKFKKEEDNDDDDEVKRLKNYKREMALNTGLASIAILASMGEYLDDLSISAVVRLYETHDIPVLMVQLLELRPWEESNPDDGSLKVYAEGQWVTWDSEELSKTEAQCWIALRGLLLHPAARQHYEITEFRKQTIAKLQRYLHENIIDQISPLIQLKQYLAQLLMCKQSKPNKSPLILETVAPIHDALVSKGSKWRNLAEKHINLIFNEENVEVMEIAKSVSETYDIDMMATVESTSQPKPIDKCAECGKVAKKRCSQCRRVWYCSRKCQVHNWAEHKLQCSS